MGTFQAELLAALLYNCPTKKSAGYVAVHDDGKESTDDGLAALPDY